MSELGVIVLVFAAVIFALAVAVFFIRFGISLERRQVNREYLSPVQAIPVEGFVQRFPGQEPGYVEQQNAKSNFEEMVRNQGRAVAYIRGRR